MSNNQISKIQGLKGLRYLLVLDLSIIYIYIIEYL